jgi:hypothetical protein
MLDVRPARNALKLVRGKYNNCDSQLNDYANSTHYAWQAGVRRSSVSFSIRPTAFFLAGDWAEPFIS